MADLTLPHAVHQFVARTNAHDAEALFDVFAPGASVVDDGTTYDTEATVREWIKIHQIDPRIVITPTSFAAHRLIASVNGEFPGGPLMFAFDFTMQDNVIANLTIESASST